jgi:hypothetical protein
MQTRLIELHQQRGRLLERIAHQRQTLAQQVTPLVGPLSLPARLAAMLQDARRFVREHPYLLGTAAVAIVVFKPRFVLRWAQRGVLAWRAWRSLRRLVPPLLMDTLRGSIGKWPRA